MNAFVTGAGGYLGSRLVAALLERGDQVRCLVRPSSATGELISLQHKYGQRLQIVHGDIQNPSEFLSEMNGCKALYHAAAVMRGAMAVRFRGNVVGTADLIRAASTAGIQRFVLISSLAVYAGPKEHQTVLDEESPLEPAGHLRDDYAYSKLEQERIAWQTASDCKLELVVLRPGVIYGPGRDCLTLRLGLKLGRWMLLMGGDQTLPYTFVGNCAGAIALAGNTGGIGGQAFNIVDDNPPTAGELLTQYRQHVGIVRTIRIPRFAIEPLSQFCQWYHEYSHGQLPAIITPYKSRAMWTPLHYSNEKAKRLLGWNPQVSFEHGLARTFASLKDQPIAQNN